MQKKCDIVAIGGATEDQFFSVDDYVMINNGSDLLRKKVLGFEYGAKIGILELDTAFGGGAANVSVAAARLGLKTAIVASLGADARGNAIARNLKANGVDIRALEALPKQQSGLSYILMSPRHDHIVFTYRGANDGLRLSPAALKLMKDARYTYLTSLSGNWEKIAKAVFAASDRVVWNPGRQQLAAGYRKLKPFLVRTDILICNRDEALELALSYEKISAKQDDPRYLLGVLKSFGPRIVIITNGGHGADAFDGHAHYYQKATSVRRVIDTTGVGDAFGASFVAGLELYGGDMKKSLALAAKNAAAVVATQGAQSGLMRLKKSSRS